MKTHPLMAYPALDRPKSGRVIGYFLFRKFHENQSIAFQVA